MPVARLGYSAVALAAVVLSITGCSSSSDSRVTKASGPTYSPRRVAACLASHHLDPLVASPSEAGSPFDTVPDLVEMIGVPATGVVAPGVRVGKPGFSGVYLFFERTAEAATANRDEALRAYMTRRAIGVGYKIGYPPTQAAAKRLESVHGNVIAIWMYPRRYYVAQSERELAACFSRRA